MSKLDEAKKIYALNQDKSRKEVIEILQETMKLSPVSAQSYYQTAKRAAIEAGGTEITTTVESIVPANTAVKVEEPKVEFIPSRKRIAQPYKPQPGSLQFLYNSLSDEERANWTKEITEYTQYYMDHPLFTNKSKGA